MNNTTPENFNFYRYDADYTQLKNSLWSAKKGQKLTWNVIIENWSTKRMEVYNIFDHGSFWNSLIEIVKKMATIQDEVLPGQQYGECFRFFEKEVDRVLRYYYWSKAEWEIIATSWPPYVEQEELDRVNAERDDRLAKGLPFYRTNVELTVGKKLDVYTQVRLNWCPFIDYLWENRYKIK